MRRFFNNLKRGCRWLKRMWNNYDFDDGYLIEVIVWKMKDMLYQLDVLDRSFVDLRNQQLYKDNGYDGDLIKSLEECIEIGERLIKDDYIIYPDIVEEWMAKHKWNDEMPDDVRKLLMDSYEDADRRRLEDNEKFFDMTDINN